MARGSFLADATFTYLFSRIKFYVFLAHRQTEEMCVATVGEAGGMRWLWLPQ